jgi:hypothetical protein
MKTLPPDPAGKSQPLPVSSRRPAGLSALPLLVVLALLAALGVLIALQVATVDPSSSSSGRASSADGEPTRADASGSAADTGATAPPTSSPPASMDLSGRPGVPPAKGPAHPTLTLPNALDLEAAFKPGIGRPLRLALARDFVFEGVVTVRSEQPEGTHVSVGATDGVSQLSLTRERLGRYRGFITHAGSPVAHRLTTGPGGELVVEQVLLSDIICAPVGAVPSGALGLPAAPPVSRPTPSTGSVLDPRLDPAPQPSVSSTPVANVPVLDSLPSASAVIYLDFDGQTVRGTGWNSYFGVETINAAPSGKTAAQITQIWQAVADDFAPFNISVTTQESRYLAAPAARRMRVIITPTAGWTGWGSNVIGVAFLDSFVWSGDTPCWAFDSFTTPAVTADTISHEVGHTMGLKHDGQGTSEYYFGYEDNLVSWNPIMGGGTSVMLTQWSRGEYRQATQQEDDLAIIANATNGFGVRTDDKGDTLATAAALRFQTGSTTTVSDEGIVEKMTDVDVMRFNAGSGTINLQVRGAEFSPNLFLRAELLDSSGTVLASGSSSKNQMDVSLTRQVSGGVFYLRVTGIGLPVPAGSAGPYNYDTSGYGSVGRYRVSGSVPTGQAVPVLSVDTSSIAVTVNQGSDAPAQTFKVRNAGTGTVSYTITGNPDWFTVSPFSGASSGADVVHTIGFATAGLTPGLYEGIIRIAAPGVEGSPQSLSVALTVVAPGSDSAFENRGAITVPSSGSSKSATPYPSVIQVSGVPSSVTTLSVDLRGVFHDWPDDLDILLVAPNGQTVMLMSGAGGDQLTPLVNADLTFRDNGVLLPRSSVITSGIYRPTDYRMSSQMPPGAPAGPYGTDLAALLSGDVNGTWQLYVGDDYPFADGGRVSAGWSISFGTSDTALAPPGGLSASDGIFSDRVRVTWDTVPGASAYRVFRADALPADPAAARLIATVSEPLHDDFTAEPGVTYRYWVRAAEGDRVSPLSAGDDGFRSQSTASNDDFAARFPLAGPAASAGGSTTAATKEPGEPAHARNAGGKSVWWSWTAPASGTVTISTQGSSFDTLLGVYTGGSLGSLVEVASDDDSGGNLTSRVIFTAAANTTYQIAVDGFGGASGNVLLAVSFDGALQPPSAPPSVQASDGAFNDRVRVSWSAAPNAQTHDIWRHTVENFSAATTIGSVGAGVTVFDDLTAVSGIVYRYWVVARNASGVSPPGGPDSGFRASGAGSNDNFSEALTLEGGSASTMAENALATKEVGEPSHAGTSGGKSLWWKWTAPQNGSVTIDTIGSNFDTVLGVYTGPTVSQTSVVAADDDSGGSLTSRVAFKVTAGTTYHIAVDGFAGSSGRISLQLALQGIGGPPPGPALLRVGEGEFTDRVRINWASVSGASSYQIRRGLSPDFSLSSVVATITSPTVTSYDDLSVTPGVVYRYWVEARNNAGASAPAGPAEGFASRVTSGNDNFANAAELSGSFDFITADSAAATAENGEPAHGGNAAAKSLWWKWTASAAGPVIISTAGSDFDTILAVYTGTSLNTLQAVASNDDADGSLTSRVLFNAAAGMTYRIAVDGSRGGSGTVKLSLRGDGSLDGDVLLTGSLDFGTVGLGQIQRRLFTIFNTGSQPVAISAINLPEGFASDWSNGVLPVGASRSVEVIFAPSAARSYGGAVSVVYGPASARSIPVWGIGASGGGGAPADGLEDLARALHRLELAGFVGTLEVADVPPGDPGDHRGSASFGLRATYDPVAGLRASAHRVIVRLGRSRYRATSLAIDPSGERLTGRLAGPAGATLQLDLALVRNEAGNVVSWTGTLQDPAGDRSWPVEVYPRRRSLLPRTLNVALLADFNDGEPTGHAFFRARMGRKGAVRLVGRTPDGARFTTQVPVVQFDAQSDLLLPVAYDPQRRSMVAGRFTLPRTPGPGAPHLTGPALWATDRPSAAAFAAVGHPWSKLAARPLVGNGLFTLWFGREFDPHTEPFFGFWIPGRPPVVFGARFSFSRSTGLFHVRWRGPAAPRAMGLLLPLEASLPEVRPGQPARGVGFINWPEDDGPSSTAELAF